jgi:hypothetical protein
MFLYSVGMSKIINENKKHTATARQARSWARRNKNFMTPYSLAVKSMKCRSNTFVEMARGTDFDYKPMWGVGIIEWNIETREFQAFSKNNQLDGLKKLFNNYEEASAYFEKLVYMKEIEA